MYPFTSSLTWNPRPNLFSTSLALQSRQGKQRQLQPRAPRAIKGPLPVEPEPRGATVAFPVTSWQPFAQTRREQIQNLPPILSGCQFENLNKLSRHLLLKTTTDFCFPEHGWLRGFLNPETTEISSSAMRPSGLWHKGRVREQ